MKRRWVTRKGGTSQSRWALAMVKATPVFSENPPSRYLPIEGDTI